MENQEKAAHSSVFIKEISCSGDEQERQWLTAFVVREFKAKASGPASELFMVSFEARSLTEAVNKSLAGLVNLSATHPQMWIRVETIEGGAVSESLVQIIQRGRISDTYRHTFVNEECFSDEDDEDPENPGEPLIETKCVHARPKLTVIKGGLGRGASYGEANGGSNV